MKFMNLIAVRFDCLEQSSSAAISKGYTNVQNYTEQIISWLYFHFELSNLNSESNGQSNAMAIKTSKNPNICPKWDLFRILLACLPLQSAAVS